MDGRGHFWTTLTSAPDAMSTDAAVCRRSWMLAPATPPPSWSPSTWRCAGTWCWVQMHPPGVGYSQSRGTASTASDDIVDHGGRSRHRPSAMSRGRPDDGLAGPPGLRAARCARCPRRALVTRRRGLPEHGPGVAGAAHEPSLTVARRLSCSGCRGDPARPASALRSGPPRTRRVQDTSPWPKNREFDSTEAGAHQRLHHIGGGSVRRWRRVQVDGT